MADWQFIQDSPLFQPSVLTAAVQRITPPLELAALQWVPKETTNKRALRLIVKEYNRRPAPVIDPANAAVRVTRGRRTRNYVEMLYVRLYDTINLEDAATAAQILGLSETMDTKSALEAALQEEVAEIQENLSATIDVTIERLLWDLWLDGKLFFADSTGEYVDIDFGVPSDNFITRQVPWSNADTAVPLTDWANCIVAMESKTGIRPSVAWMNATTYNLLLTWASTGTKAQNLGALNRIEWEGGRIARIDGVEVRVYDNYFVDETGARQKFIPDNRVIFLGDKSNFPLIRGASIIPHPTEDRRDFGVVEGRFSYARFSDEPVGIHIYVGERFLPVVYDPRQIVVLTT